MHTAIASLAGDFSSAISDRVRWPVCIEKRLDPYRYRYLRLLRGPLAIGSTNRMHRKTGRPLAVLILRLGGALDIGAMKPYASKNG